MIKGDSFHSSMRTNFMLIDFCCKDICYFFNTNNLMVLFIVYFVFNTTY